MGIRIMAFSLRRAAAALLIAGLLHGTQAVMAQTPVTVVTFAGATNLPLWIALDRGLFTKEGLNVSHEVTRGSTAVIEGAMSGKYQFASMAFDNTIANAEGVGDVNSPGYDLVGIAGVHSGMNKIVTSPEVKSFADLRGKVVASDALNSGYGLVLVRILQMNGLLLDRDYKALAVGSGPSRLAAMREGRAAAAALSSPDDIEAKKLGFNILADATELIGAYQGSAFVVRRSWAKEHEKEVVSFLRAMIAATDIAFADRDRAIAVLRNRIKSLSAEDAASIYASLVSGKGGLNRGAAINMDGVKTLLDLRNNLGDGKQILNDPMKYVDLSYYEKARR
jgi:ABC-type nitrate/sulfonate/bicarbonate transport system substrate-binding protein